MSILIKGMEMPKDCWMCNFVDRDYGNCLVDGKEPDDYNKPKDCPLVPVPPHGRLIDADELMKRYGTMPFSTVIVDAPTIIEAEEGE